MLTKVRARPVYLTEGYVEDDVEHKASNAYSRAKCMPEEHFHLKYLNCFSKRAEETKLTNPAVSSSS